RTDYEVDVRLHCGHHLFAEGEQRKIDPWKGFLEKRSFSRADAFVAVSNFVKEHTGKYLSTGKKPVEIIRIPVDGKLFAASDPDKAIFYRLVFAGTVCEKKGIRQLIEALKYVIPLFPLVHLDIYGRDWFFSDGRSSTECP